MTGEPLSVLAWKLAAAMSFGQTVVVELRTRPKRTLRGTVVKREIDAARKMDPKKEGTQSNVLVTLRLDGGGEEVVSVERVASVKRVGR